MDDKFELSDIERIDNIDNYIDFFRIDIFLSSIVIKSKVWHSHKAGKDEEWGCRYHAVSNCNIDAYFKLECFLDVSEYDWDASYSLGGWGTSSYNEKDIDENNERNIINIENDLKANIRKMYNLAQHHIVIKYVNSLNDSDLSALNKMFMSSKEGASVIKKIYLNGNDFISLGTSVHTIIANCKFDSFYKIYDDIIMNKYINNIKINDNIEINMWVLADCKNINNAKEGKYDWFYQEGWAYCENYRHNKSYLFTRSVSKEVLYECIYKYARRIYPCYYFL